MNLRLWQSECVELALDKYCLNPHFLCLATPGAGKSIMSAELAARLYEAGKIDLVLCFAPTVDVATGLANTFERHLGRSFDGRLGAVGGAYTYQSMTHQENDFWELLEQYRVFVVFDEIHHCSGTRPDNANRWGEEILTNIQDRAAYTLALTGTPWRSDKKPIVLSRYGSDGIECDYIYGLRRAVVEGVCRTPKIVLIDNDRLVVDEKGESQVFSGIEAMLKGSKRAYRAVLNNDAALRHSIGLAVDKLTALRVANPVAAGLVVASSVAHARAIVRLLREEFGQDSTLVTYREPQPQQIIDDFRCSSQPWIVSVGMISEGTDIPRIQVCCHLSTVTTELYFRQVLGRGIRMTPHCNGETWLYTFAEPKIVEYANRIAEDLPEHDVVYSDVYSEDEIEQFPIAASPNILPATHEISADEEALLDFDWGTSTTMTDGLTVEPSMEFLGRFQQRLCSLTLPT